MTKKLFYAGLFLLLNSKMVLAALPDYSAPFLLARANVRDGYNLPPMTYLTNVSPSINNRGDVAFKLLAIEGKNTQGIWVKGHQDQAGKIGFTAPEDRHVTEPVINDLGKIVFNQFDDFESFGLYSFDLESFSVDHVLPGERDKDIFFYTYPQMTTNGMVYFRGTRNTGERAFYLYDKKLNTDLKVIIEEGVSTFGDTSSYLFKPSLNDIGELAFKRRIGEKGEWGESEDDQILLVSPTSEGFTYKVIAEDQDADSDSAYKGFLNTASLSNNSLIAFTAILDNAEKAIVVYQNDVLSNVAKDNSEEISEIEIFSPKINSLGRVLFRAKDKSGKRALFLASKEGVKRLIGEGDQVMTDLGAGKILSNPNYPGFSGDVDMNDAGDIVFSSVIVSAQTDKEWGTAIFKMSVQTK